MVQQVERIVNAAAELVTDPLQGLNPAPLQDQVVNPRPARVCNVAGQLEGINLGPQLGDCGDDLLVGRGTQDSQPLGSRFLTQDSELSTEPRAQFAELAPKASRCASASSNSACIGFLLSSVTRLTFCGKGLDM
ncbi:hypothetical protein [Streptomyces pratensis]|uniref:hypothetical protein n=1 Tax=Streptomyces pratensis TaxID=1169025 RepID=UPI00363B64E3